jgi:glycosyltransferase involved in cell wall biosynthesis
MPAELASKNLIAAQTEPIRKPLATVLALIPAYNEAERIAPVIARTARYLPVLVVDDGSVDATAEVAHQAGAQVLLQTPNQGKGAALKAGFRHALAEGWEAVLTLDADGQHDPQEIPRFLQAYKMAPKDLIIGARDFGKIPLIRRIANSFGRLSLSWAMGRQILDNQSGYRLIRRRLMEATLSSQEQGFQFEVEMIMLCIQRGFSLGWVPIRTIYLPERRSHINPIDHAIGFARMLLRTRRAMRKKRPQG